MRRYVHLDVYLQDNKMPSLVKKNSVLYKCHELRIMNMENNRVSLSQKTRTKQQQKQQQ